MRATAKYKVVTSGRLTGGVKGQPARRRGTPNPGPSARPEPAYSLHSTDAEDQVTTLHEGLDRCAALLGGILQADATASPSAPTPVTCAAAKSTPSISLGKKPMKKVSKKTVQRKSPSCPGATGDGPTPRATRAPGSPAAHSGVKLHPPQGLTRVRAFPSPSVSVPPAIQSFPTEPGRRPPPCETEPCPLNTHCNEEEEEFVPVRDFDTRHAANHTATAGGGDSCDAEVSTLRRDTHGEGVRTVPYLLGELKALITGQGSVAERLLSHLEQALSSPLPNDGDSNIQTESVPDLASLQRHNVQLRRRVQILNQQLKEKEKAERRQNMDSNKEVTELQEEELTAAQSRLQELQRDVAELRAGLQDREAQNALTRADLEATRSLLVDTEREKRELASLAHQRQEEMVCLKRMLQSHESSNSPAAAADGHQPPPTEHVARYLMSLGRLDPADAQRESDIAPQRGPAAATAAATTPADRSRCSGEAQPGGWRRNSALSQCDVESLWSDWSARSGSTFDTRDEAAFRDGLAALDASIASLQKTIQLDLRR